jgi:hypothetical protein
MQGTIQFVSGEYTVSGTLHELPVTYSTLVERARLHDDLGVAGKSGTVLVVAAGSAFANWPELIVSQRFDPGPVSGFQPGVLLVPERHLLLIGAGIRLLAYDLRGPRRLWEDEADTGFWGWKRHGDVIVMAAELELAAWDLEGRKLWSTFVEPPWVYEVRGTRLHLDVMGKKSDFALEAGPRPSSKS